MWAKIISLITALVFMVNSIGYAGPAVSPQSIVPSYAEASEGRHSPQSINIPESYGRIEKYNVPKIEYQKSKSPQVILIKDAHCNYEAQRNIAKILETLAKDYGINIVALEGGAGKLDYSRYGEAKNKDVKEKVTDAFVKQGYLSGPEYLAITGYNELPIGIYGIEDSQLYAKDFISFRKTLKGFEEIKEFTDALKGAADKLKEKIYGEELLSFIRKYESYKTNKTPLSDWIKYLCLQSPVAGRQINLVMKSIKLEDGIDFKKVEKERAELIKECEKTLPKEEIEKLVKNSLMFRLGKISSLEYYNYIEQYAGTYNLKKYIHLVKLQSKIDEDKLFNELDEIEKQIKEGLFKDNRERELDNLDCRLNILNDLLNLRITRKELDCYDNHRNEFSPDSLLSFIKIQCPLNNIALQPVLNEKAVHELLINLINEGGNFYKIALDRDKALIKNTLLAMEKEGKDKAVMVVGGFHAEGIIEEFKKQGIDYVVIIPKITKEQDTPYLKIMLDERIKPETGENTLAIAKLLAFGEKNKELIKAIGAANVAKLMQEKAVVSYLKGGKKPDLGQDNERKFIDSLQETIQKLRLQYGEGAADEAISLAVKIFSDLAGNVSPDEGNQVTEELKKIAEYQTRAKEPQKEAEKGSAAGKPIDTGVSHMKGLKLKKGKPGLWINGARIDNVENGIENRKKEISQQAGHINIIYKFKFKTVHVSNEFKKICQKNGVDISWLEEYLENRFSDPKTAPAKDDIYIDLLSDSEYLFEDHEQNGYIGINEQLFSIKDSGLRIKLLKLGLRHELGHEAYMKNNDVDELKLSLLDVESAKILGITMSDIIGMDISDTENDIFKMMKGWLESPKVTPENAKDVMEQASQVFHWTQDADKIKEILEIAKGWLESPKVTPENAKDIIGLAASLAGIIKSARGNADKTKIKEASEIAKGWLESPKVTPENAKDITQYAYSLTVNVRNCGGNVDEIKEVLETAKAWLESDNVTPKNVKDIMEKATFFGVAVEESEHSDRTDNRKDSIKEVLEIAKALLESPKVTPENAKDVIGYAAEIAQCAKKSRWGNADNIKEVLEIAKALLESSKVTPENVKDVMKYAAELVSWVQRSNCHVDEIKQVLETVKAWLESDSVKPENAKDIIAQAAELAQKICLTGGGYGSVIKAGLEGAKGWLESPKVTPENAKDVMAQAAELAGWVSKCPDGFNKTKEVLEIAKIWLETPRVIPENAKDVMELTVNLVQQVQEASGNTDEVKAGLEGAREWLESPKVTSKNVKDVMERAANLAAWATGLNGGANKIKEILGLGYEWLKSDKVTEINAEGVMKQAANLAWQVNEVNEMKEILGLGYEWLKSDKVTKTNAKDVMEEAADLAACVKASGGEAKEIKEILRLGYEWLKSDKVTETNAKDVMEQAANLGQRVKEADGEANEIKAGIESGLLWLGSPKVTPENARIIIGDAANISAQVKIAGGGVNEIKEILGLVYKLLENPKVEPRNAELAMFEATHLARQVRGAGGGVNEMKAGFEGGLMWLGSDKAKKMPAQEIIEKAATLAAQIKKAGGGVNEIEAGFKASMIILDNRIILGEICHTIESFLEYERLNGLKKYNAHTRFEQFVYRLLLAYKIGIVSGYEEIMQNALISELIKRNLFLTPSVINRIVSAADKQQCLDALSNDISVLDLQTLTMDLLTEEQKDLLYSRLCRDYPGIMERVPHYNFLGNSIVHHILAKERGDESFFYFSDSDRDEFISLSLDIEESIRKYTEEKHKDDALWETSFRQQMQLHRDFVRQYLGEAGQARTEEVLQKFILACYAHYGDMFGVEIEQFKNILCRIIEQHFNLFVRFSLGDDSARQYNIPTLVNNLQNASVNNVAGEEGVLYGVKPYQDCYWGIRRGVEFGHPVLCILEDNTHQALDESITKLSKETNGTVYRIGMNQETDRGVLFVNAVPDKNGVIHKVPGILPILIEQAQNDSSKPIYLVLENIEALPGGVRVDLNPVLWERRFKVPELGKEYVMPPNLHIIAVMHKRNGIKDEAFANRFEKVRVKGIIEKDIEKLLINKYGITQKTALKAGELYNTLQNEKWKDSRFGFTIQDIVNVFQTSEGRGGKGEYIYEELYRYFLPRFRYIEDLDLFTGNFIKILGIPAIPKEWIGTKVSVKDGKLTIDGVTIALGKEVQEYIKKNPGADFNEIVLRLCKYVIRKQDLLVLSQCVRQMLYGGSPFIILEGISGEGKTEFAFLLGKLFDRKNLSYTIHKRSGIEQFRGGVYGDRRGGFRVVRETPFIKALKEGNKIINFSELNTNWKQAIAYWLMPEAMGLSEHIMPELPSEDGGIERVSAADNNLFIADINPLDYTAREPLPVRLREHSRTYWMGYDYANINAEYQDEVTKELTGIIESLFSVYSGSSRPEYAKQLAKIYTTLQKMLYTNNPSRYQVLTLRDIIRVIKLFKQRGSKETAFKTAVRDILWGMWIEKEVRRGAQEILNANKISIQGYNPGTLTGEILSLNLAPVILHSDGTKDGLQVLKQAIKGKKQYQYEYKAVNRSIDYDTLVGGGAVDEKGNIGEYSGSLLKVIEQCIQNPDKTYIIVFDNIHELSADTAVGFNRILQDGVIDISDGLKQVLVERLKKLGIQKKVEEVYGRLPNNIRIAGVSYANDKPMSEDKLPMSGAELSRYINIHTGEGMSFEWIKRYLSPKISNLSKTLQNQILSRMEAVYKAYDREADRGILISRQDLDEFIKQLKKSANPGADINRIFSETVSSALRELFDTDPELKFKKEPDGIYLAAGTHNIKTRYKTIQEAESEEYLIPIKENRQIYSAVVSAIEAGRRVFLLEGPPGVGKTAFAEDFGKRMNLPFKKSSMYREIEIWDYLGRIEQTGPGKFRLTCTREEGEFISDFLKFIEKGGVYCFDEGNISRNSVQVISFLMQIMRGEPVELGLYHNGIELDAKKMRIAVNPETYIFVTYNPAGITEGRKPLSRETNLWAKKIWVTDNWSRESYRELIKNYDKEKKLTDKDIEKLIDIHTTVKYIIDEQYRMRWEGSGRAKLEALRSRFTQGKFRDIYKYQYSVTPRELIRITKAIQNGSDICEGVLLNYGYQFSDRDEFASIIQIIETILTGYAEWYKGWIRGAQSEYKAADGAFFVPVENQTGALRAMDVSIKSGSHTMLVSEDGAEPYELVKAYAANKGYELKIFWGNPYSNGVELIGGRAVQFGSMDKQGTAIQEAVGLVKGFIGAYLIEKGTEKEIPPALLYLGALDTLSHEDLELLNDFLNTGEIELEGKVYVLPENVHLIVEASIVRQKHFSSPFYNRFQKVGVPAVTDFMEIKRYMNLYYNGLTPLEQELIYNAVMLAWYMDTGLFSDNYNLGKERFLYRYGFGIKDIWQICELALLQKQGKRQIDSVHEILQAVVRYYLGAVDDVNGDRGKFIQGLLTEVFTYEGINENTIKEITVSLREVKREWIQASIQTGIENQLLNGIWIEQIENKYILHTPGNQYPIRQLPNLGEELKLSEGLIFGNSKQGLYIKQGFIKSAGNMDTGLTETAKQYALPPEEVHEGNFIQYSGVINEIAANLFWAIRRVSNTGNYERCPKPVVLMGATGGAKSTFIRNSEEVLGIPVYTLNCVLQMEPDSYIGRMELGGKEGVLFKLQELFSNVGKINGEYKMPSGKKVQSTRKILFLDEANVSPEIMYVLRPLWKGERKFTIYYLGMALEIELDPEVIVVFSGNPEDRFEGRGGYPLIASQECTKVWVPALQEWSVSERVTRKDAEEILKGLHRRRMGRLSETVKLEQAPEPRTNMEAPIIQLQKPEEGVTYTERKNTGKPVIPKKEEKPKKQPMTIKKHLPIRYNIKEIESKLIQIDKVAAQKEKLDYFITEILPQFILAVGDGAADIKDYADNPESLAYRIITRLQGIDEETAKIIAAICTIYSQPIVYLFSAVREQVLKLRQYMLKHGSSKFLFSFPILKDHKLYVFLKAEPVTYKTTIEQLMMEDMQMPEDVLTRLPVSAYAVEKHPFGEHETARGVTKGVSDEKGYYALVYGASTGKDKEVLSWVGYHELGHVVNELRIRFEQLRHPNVELFSMLFPVLFAKENKRYMEEELLKLLTMEADKNDYYCQAAKGIFNAFVKLLKEEQPKNKVIQRLELITDKFEKGSVLKIWKGLDKLSNEDIKHIGIKIYNDCYAKKFQGEYYLNTTGKGKYKVKRGGRMSGDAISEFTEGELQQAPDVEWEDVPPEEQTEIEQKIDIQGEETGKKEEIGNVEMDIEGTSGGTEGIRGAEGIQVIRGTWVEEYSRIFGAYARRFLDIFSKEPEREEIHRPSGRMPDMRRVVVNSPNPFKVFVEEDTRPQVSFGITVDVSGSITGDPRLVKGFTLMSKFFLSLMYSATKLRKSDVWYGLSAIGEQFHEGLPMAQKYTEQALEQIVSSDDRQWMNAFNDGDGINTVNLINGLRKKWENSNIPRENRLEIVFTDGGETSEYRNNPEKLKEIAEQFEYDTGVTLVFVGIGTKEVTNYHRYIVLSSEPNPEEFINIISKLGVQLTRRGRLDAGDLADMAGVIPKQPMQVKMPVLSQPLQQKPETAGTDIAHAEGFKLKNGRPMMWRGEIVDSLQSMVDSKIKKQSEYIGEIEGKKVWIDNELLKECPDFDFKAFLTEQFKNEDTLPKENEIVIVLLSQSTHLFEDHTQNGFIGVNKQLFVIASPKGAKQSDPKGHPERNEGSHALIEKLLKLGLRHELKHEAGVGNSAKEEKNLLDEDVEFSMKEVITIYDLKMLEGILDQKSEFIHEILKKEEEAKRFVENTRLLRQTAIEYKDLAEQYGYLPYKILYDAAGEYVFEYYLPALNKIFNEQGSKTYWLDLVRLGISACKNRRYFFEYAIPKLIETFSEKELQTYWPDIVRLGISAGENADDLFKDTLPKLKETFSKEELQIYWPDLVRLGISAGENMRSLFESGLPALKHLINSRKDLNNIGKDLIRLGTSAGENMVPLFERSLPALKYLINSRKDLNNIGKDLIRLGISAGKDAFALFQWTIPNLTDTFSKEELQIYWPDLVRLGISAGENMGRLFGSDLPALKHLINSREDLNNIGNDIIRLGISAGGDVGHLSGRSLLALKHLINSRKDLNNIGKDLIRLGISADTNADSLFTYSLPALKHLINSREDLNNIGNDIIRLGVSSGENARYLFQYGLPALKHLINSREDLNNIGKDLIRLGISAGGDVGHLFGGGLPALKHLINSREDLNNIGNDIIRLGISADKNMGPLFESSLYALKHLINSRKDLNNIGKDLIRLGISADTNADSLFWYSLPALKYLINSREDLNNIGNDIIRLGAPAGKGARVLFVDGIPNLNRTFSEKELQTYWPDIVRLGISAGRDAGVLFQHSLPRLKETFSKKKLQTYWPDLIQLGISAGENVESLFGFAIPELIETFSEKELQIYWPDILRLGISADKNANSLFKYGLPALKHLIKSREDLKNIADDLLAILRLCTGVENQTMEELHHLTPLLQKYPDSFKAFIKPIIYDQRQGAFLCLQGIKKLWDSGAIKSEADLKYLKSFIIKNSKRAYDLLENFLIKGIQEDIIAKPISIEAESIDDYLRNVPYAIIEIYDAYKKNPSKAKKLKKRCKLIHNKILNGDTSKVETDPLFGAMLMHVFPPAVTMQREQYQNLYKSRPDRKNDTAMIPDKLQMKEYEVFRSKYVRKNASQEPLDESGWEIILKSVQEVNKEEKSTMTEEEITQLGMDLITIWVSGGNKIDEQRKELIKRLYRYYRSKGYTLPDNLSTINNIMAHKQFMGDTMRDLIGECTTKYKERDLERYSRITSKMFKTEIETPKKAAKIVMVLLNRFRNDPDEAKKKISHGLKIDDPETMDMIWEEIKDIDNENVLTNILEKIRFKPQTGKESTRIAHLLQGEDYSKMQGVISANYEPQRSGEKMKLRFSVSKSKAHGVVGLNMGVCVAPDEKLWNNPNFMNVIIWDSNNIAQGGMHIMVIEEDNGKKYLTLPGINPSFGLLAQAASDDIYNHLMEYAQLLAKGLKCEAVLIPVNSTIHSNISEIQRVISAKNYEKIPLSKIHPFSYSPHEYSFQKCFIVPDIKQTSNAVTITTSPEKSAGYEDRDSNPEIIKALEEGTFVCVDNKLEKNDVGPYKGQDLTQAEKDILSEAIKMLDEADRGILEGLLIIFIPGLSGHFSKEKYPQIYLDRNLLSNPKYAEDLKWQMHHEIQEKSGKTHAELIREELIARFKIDIKGDLKQVLEQKLRDLLRILELDGRVTGDELEVIVDKAKMAVEIFNRYKQYGLEERINLVQEITAIQWAIEELQKNNVPAFVNDLVTALGGDEEVTGELVRHLYDYDSYDDYFVLMLKGIRTMLNIKEGTDADKYLKMLDKYMQVKSKFEISDMKFAGNGDEIYDAFLRYRNNNRQGACAESAKDLLPEIAGVVTMYLIDKDRIVGLLENVRAKDFIIDGIEKIINRKGLREETKTHILDDLQWDEGVKLLIESSYLAEEQNGRYVINPMAGLLLWLMHRAGKNLMVLYKDVREKEIIESWLKENNLEALFVTEYPKEESKVVVGMLTNKTAEGMQIPKGHRVIKGTGSGEDDLMLMSCMAGILGSQFRLSNDYLNEQFNKLYTAYYKENTTEEDIEYLVKQAVDAVMNGLAIVLPPIAPFAKAYYNALRNAMEVTASAA